MSNGVLHFIIADVDFKEKINFYERVRKLNLPIWIVQKSVDFDIAIKSLERNQEITCWVHLEATKKERSYTSYPGEDIGNSLKQDYPQLKFNYVTREKDPEIDETKDGTKIYDIKEISALIRNQSYHQKISDFFFIDNSTNSKLPQNLISEIDLAIITALYEDEYENVIDFIEERKTINLSTFNISLGQISMDNNDSVSVVAARPNEIGMIDSGILTAIIVNEFRPKYLVLAGVCGGRESKNVKIGDIIIPRKIFTYQFGKFTEEGFKPRLQTVDIDESLLQIIDEHKNEICSKIMSSDKSRSWKEKSINAIAGPATMACGTAVINKAGKLENEISERDDNVHAVDMESYSVVRAVDIINNGYTKPIIIKSIMDFTENKTDNDKSFAAFTSAQFAKHLIKDVLF